MTTRAIKDERIKKARLKVRLDEQEFEEDSKLASLQAKLNCLLFLKSLRNMPDLSRKPSHSKYFKNKGDVR